MLAFGCTYNNFIYLSEYLYAKQMIRQCLECDSVLAGREDKKFCCEGCRNSFNNKANKDTNNFMRNVNNRLRRNYRILAGINTGIKAEITRNELVEKGFDFNFFTNVKRTSKGKTYYFLYDQGYLPINEKRLKLVRKPFTMK